ncbi:MAG: hypothetical protein EBX52_05625 [Proteobacteria bacterium]|nr:hypothetical protein [Pseudomonadota bacterium]
MGGLDPSKMTPAVIAELTEAMKMLTPDQMMRIQTLIHNQMAGFNVANEMAEFEKNLPQGFREKMARILYMANGVAVPPGTATNVAAPSAPDSAPVEEPKSVDDARLVILRSVSQGLMSPEEALKILFP